MDKKKFEYNYGITHGGKFHADDVFSSALLLILNPNIKISREFKIPKLISEDTIVFDIGFGEFDHHQPDAEYRDGDGVKYAAFGLIWRRFGHYVVSEKQVQKFDEMFVQYIDYADNTYETNTMSSTINTFMPNWDDENQDVEGMFWVAVDFAKSVLLRHIDRMNSEERANSIIEEAKQNSKDKIVVLSKFCPWADNLSDTDMEFVVYPSLRGGFNAQVVIHDGGLPIISFPAHWGGKTADELNTYSEGLNFCHVGRFLISTATQEQAINACRIAQKAAAEEEI